MYPLIFARMEVGLPTVSHFPLYFTCRSAFRIPIQLIPCMTSGKVWITIVSISSWRGRRISNQEGYSCLLAFCQPCPLPHLCAVQLPSMAPLGSKFSAVLEAMAHAPEIFKARLAAPSGIWRCDHVPCTS